MTCKSMAAWISEGLLSPVPFFPFLHVFPLPLCHIPAFQLNRAFLKFILELDHVQFGADFFVSPLAMHPHVLNQTLQKSKLAAQILQVLLLWIFINSFLGDDQCTGMHVQIQKPQNNQNVCLIIYLLNLYPTFPDKIFPRQLTTIITT